MSEYTYRCITCGGVRTSFACPTCAQIKAIEQANPAKAAPEASESSATELLQEQRVHQSIQLTIEAARFAQVQRQTEILEKEAQLQTKLIEENGISDQAAYEEGYTLTEILYENPSDVTTLIRLHTISLGLTLDGEVSIANLVADFQSSRLRKAYIDGVSTRIKDNFSQKISFSTMMAAAGEAGENCTASLVLANDSGVPLSLKVTLFSNGDKVIHAYTGGVLPKIKYVTDVSTGVVSAEIIDVRCFECDTVTNSIALKNAFVDGVHRYIQTINSSQECEHRIKVYQDSLRKAQAVEICNQEARLEYEKVINSTAALNFKLKCLRGAILLLIAFLVPYFYFTRQPGLAFLAGLLVFPVMMNKFRSDDPVLTINEIPVVVDPLFKIFISANDGAWDPLYKDAVSLVLESQCALVSPLQRSLKIGYIRALRLIEAMEAENLVSAKSETGNRVVLKTHNTPNR